MAIYQKLRLDPRFEKLPFKKLIVISLFLNVIMVGVGLLAKLILPPEIPLFFGLPQTSEQLASSTYIILPATMSFCISILNSTIAVLLNNSYLKRVLAFATILVTILSLIATFKIIFLVGSY